MDRELQPWSDLDGDPNSPFEYRSFQREGMEFVDPKHVVMRDERTGDPIFAIDHENKRLSWDPRVIDTETMKSLMRKVAKEIEIDDRRKNQGFGY